MLTSVVHVLHSSEQGQRDAANRFRRAIAPSAFAPRNLPPPLWPTRRAGFLIANPRSEILTSPTKQTIAAKSNRERMAFFPHDLSLHLSAIKFRSGISNSNIRIIKNSPKCLRNNTYAFSNRNKIDLFAVCLPPRFSPRKGTSRDMIPALPPLQ